MSCCSSGAASSSGRFAGVIAPARMSPLSRSVAMWRLYPLKRLVLLLASVAHLGVLD